MTVKIYQSYFLVPPMTVPPGALPRAADDITLRSPILNRRRGAAIAGRSSFAAFNLLPVGFEIQPPQPPTIRREVSGALARGVDIDAVFAAPPIPAPPFGYDPIPPQPRQRDLPARAGAIAGRSQFASFNLLPIAFEQPLNVYRRRLKPTGSAPEAIAALVAAPPPIAAFAYDIPQPSRRNPIRAQGAFGRSQFAFSVNFLPGFEPILPPQKRKVQNHVATKGSSAFAIYPNWYNFGFEVQAAQPPNPKPERGAAISRPLLNIEFTVTPPPTTPWGYDSQVTYRLARTIKSLPTGEIVPPFVARPFVVGWDINPNTPLAKRVRRIETKGAVDIFAPYQQFYDIGFSIQSPQPPQVRTERAGAIAGPSFIDAILVAAPVQSWGWEPIQPTRGPLLAARAAGWLSQDLAPLAPLVVSTPPWGWPAALPDPFRRPWGRAGGIVRGDDGTQFGLIGFNPMGFEVQSYQPQHVRWARAAAGMFGEPGIEGVFSFVSQPIVFGFDGPRIDYRPRRERAGALAAGAQGNEAAYINWLLAGFDAPAWALRRAIAGRDLRMGETVLLAPPQQPSFVDRLPTELRQATHRGNAIGAEFIFSPPAAAPAATFIDDPRADLRRVLRRTITGNDPVLAGFPEARGWDLNPSGVLLVRPARRGSPIWGTNPTEPLRGFQPHGFDAQPFFSRVRPRPPQSTIDVLPIFNFVPPTLRHAWEMGASQTLRYLPNRRFGAALEWQRLDFRPLPTTHNGPNLCFANDFPLFGVTADDGTVYAGRAADFAQFTCTASESLDGTQQIMGTYEINTELEVVGTFADSLSGAADDPDTITLYLRDPTGATQTLVFPAAGMTKVGVGEYTYQFVATISGTYTYKWQGVGAVIATSPDTTFTVNSSSLIPG